jgi:hypothetical protein
LEYNIEMDVDEIEWENVFKWFRISFIEGLFVTR